MEKTFIHLENRRVIRIAGTDSRTFLQGLISTNVEHLSETRAIYGSLLTPQGKFLHDFFLAQKGDALLLDCDRSRSEDLLRRLTMYKLRADVELGAPGPEMAVWALLGPADGERAGGKKAAGSSAMRDDGVIFIDPRLDRLGARAILPLETGAGALAGMGYAEGRFHDYERLRLGLGVADGATDLIADKSLLLESNFEELNGVDFEKGCYVGQEVTSRTKHRGLVRKRLFRVDVEGPLPAHGTRVQHGENNAGIMYGGLGNLGLALLRLDQVAAAESAGKPLTAGQATLHPVKPDWADF